MSLRRDLLRAAYPIYRMFAQFTPKGVVVTNDRHTTPPNSFYELSTVLNNGAILDFESLRGKKVLIVNTASDCIYTAQYAGLERLYKEMQGSVVIICFPANDFNRQEKGSDEEIAAFCETNYHINFPLAQKSKVVGPGKNPVFAWLSDSRKNGWNDRLPMWNFTKYLVNEKGQLTHYFGPAVSPGTIKKQLSA